MSSANFSLLPIPEATELWTRGSLGLNGSEEVFSLSAVRHAVPHGTVLNARTH